jgi:hypothetical protein
MMAGHGQQEVRRSTSAEYNLAGSLPKTLILPIYICIYSSIFYRDSILEGFCSVFCVVGDAFCRCDGLHEVYIPLCNSLSCVYRSFDKLVFSAAVCQHAGRGLSASVDSQDTLWIFSMTEFLRLAQFSLMSCYLQSAAGSALI